MFIKKVNLVLAALCTIFFQGILSLELYSEERINQWKVDIVIEKKPTEELIKSRKDELKEKIRREREAAKKEGNKENGKILGGLIDRIKDLKKQVEDKVVPLLIDKDDSNLDKKEEDDINAPVLVEISISGELLEINNKYLSLLPTIGANEIINIPMNQVTSVTRNIIPNGVEDIIVGDNDFRVLLRDGSELIGEPTSLNEESLILFLKNTELSIPLPINEIIRIDREKVPEGSPDYSFPEFPKKHIASLSTGEVVAGQLLPSLDSDNWLRISSPILSSEVPLSLVNSLVFPASQETLEEVERQLAQEIKIEQDGNNKVPQENKIEVDEPEEIKVEIAEPKIRNLVSLSPVGMLWADKVQVNENEVIISALGKDGISIPRGSVESLNFGQEGLPSSAPVLVWGGYSDEDDEYLKTVNSLEGRIPQRKLLRSFAKVPDPDFVRTLKRSRVLLVPEMEGFRRTKMKESMEVEGRGCPTWQETMRGHLKRGGNIIFLSPTGEALSFINECGFGRLSSGPAAAGWELTEEGKKTGIKLDGFIKNVNASHYYRRSDPWEVWGQAQGGVDSGILIGRKVDRGWVIIFGSDFYQQNETIKEVLHSLVKFNGRR